jgi:hypothetical protein
MEMEGGDYFLSRCQRGNSAQIEVAVALEKQDFSSAQLIQHPEHDGLWTAGQKSAGDSTFCMKKRERERRSCDRTHL